MKNAIVGLNLFVVILLVVIATTMTLAGAAVAQEELCYGNSSAHPDDEEDPAPHTGPASPEPDESLSAHQMRGLIKEHFPADQIGHAMAVAKCESGWANVKGSTNSDGTTDWGVFQLNDGGTLQGALEAIGVKAPTKAKAQQAALDPDINVKAAAWIYSQRQWAPWVCAHKVEIVDALYSSSNGPKYGFYDRFGELTDDPVTFDRRGNTPADDMDRLGIEPDEFTAEEQKIIADMCRSQLGVGLTDECPATPWPHIERGIHQNLKWVVRCAAVLWPEISSIGTIRDDPYPDHPSGKAADMMIPTAAKYPWGCAEPDKPNPKYEKAWDEMATYFMNNAEAYGISYIAWKERIWNAGFEEPKPISQWRFHSDRNSCNGNHYNHIHITVNDELGTGPPIDQIGGGGASGGGTFTLPIKSSGWKLKRHNDGTQPGMRMHPILGYPRCHAGIDISAYTGQPLYATSSGTVTNGSDGGRGNYVDIGHGGGVTSHYFHLSRHAVTSGQQVRQGQLIGYAGSTGLSSGPHLHFEIRINGGIYDPRHWLYKNVPKTKAC